MQITNILRDIGEDYKKRNRLYLPISLMSDFNISKHEIIDTIHYNVNKDIPKNIIDVMNYLMELSSKFYDDILEIIQYFHDEARLPLLASSFIYKGIESEIIKQDYKCFNKRCYTSEIDRILLLKKANIYIKNRL